MSSSRDEILPNFPAPSCRSGEGRGHAYRAGRQLAAAGPPRQMQPIPTGIGARPQTRRGPWTSSNFVTGVGIWTLSTSDAEDRRRWMGFC